MMRIEQLSIDHSVPIQEGKGSARIPLPTLIELWSPEHPILYPVDTLLEDASLRGSTKPNRFDQIKDRIGLREIRIESGQILLNGKPIFLKGISLHEDHVELGKTTNPELIRASIRHFVRILM